VNSEYMLYKAKKGREIKPFDASEWLAARCSHITNRGERMGWCCCSMGVSGIQGSITVNKT